jgi:clan AA aspartic protease
MIIGQVNTQREATIPLRVRGDLGSDEITCVIDTGFSGYLCLPAARVHDLGLPYFGTAKYELGDGTEVVFSVYTGTVEWEGHDRGIHVLASGGGELVGMRMLYGHSLHMEVTDGGLVEIA